MKKGLVAEQFSVLPSSHRQGTWTSLWSECGPWEGFVTVHDSFYIHHATDSAHHWSISQERQYCRRYQTYSCGIRLQVRFAPAQTSLRISRVKPFLLFSRMPGQCLNTVMWCMIVCSKVILEACNGTNKLTFIEYLLCTRHLPTTLKFPALPY